MRRVPFQLRLQRLQRCLAVRDVVRHALRRCREVGATLDQRQRQDVQRRVVRRFATGAGLPLGLVRRLAGGAPRNACRTSKNGSQSAGIATTSSMRRSECSCIVAQHFPAALPLFPHPIPRPSFGSLCRQEATTTLGRGQD